MNADLAPLYERLDHLGRGASRTVVVGQMGQSLDGFIATETGASHYVTGEESLVHLHRLRAWADVVVVGWRTAVSDDPQLTTRLAPGDDPVRAVIDPRGRVPRSAALFAGAAHLSARIGPSGDVVVPTGPGGEVAPEAVLRALATRGLRRVLVEGGGRVVSSFLRAGCLDRLHVVVAPLLIGGGVPSVRPSAVAELDRALRPKTDVYTLGPDVLFDMDLGTENNPSTSV